MYNCRYGSVGKEERSGAVSPLAVLDLLGYNLSEVVYLAATQETNNMASINHVVLKQDPSCPCNDTAEMKTSNIMYS